MNPLVTKCLSCQVLAPTPADADDNPTKGAADPARVLEFVISTGGVDRDGDTIDPKGWELDEFNKSGVVLWQHGNDPNVGMFPIARPLKTWVSGGVLRSRAEFAPATINPMAEQVFQALKGGFIKGVSVRFRPIAYDPRKNSENDRGLAYTQQELLEYSPVAIPANPQASVVDGHGGKAEIAGIVKSIMEEQQAAVDKAVQTAKEDELKTDAARAEIARTITALLSAEIGR